MDEFINELEHYKAFFGDIKLSELIFEILEEPNIITEIENKYYKFKYCDSFRLIHIKSSIEIDGKDTIFTYDVLEVIEYQKVSFSSDCESTHMFLFDDPCEEISEEEWIKELCYYFKRVPGNDEICCPNIE